MPDFQIDKFNRSDACVRAKRLGLKLRAPLTVKLYARSAQSIPMMPAVPAMPPMPTVPAVIAPPDVLDIGRAGGRRRGVDRQGGRLVGRAHHERAHRESREDAKLCKSEFHENFLLLFNKTVLRGLAWDSRATERAFRAHSSKGRPR